MSELEYQELLIETWEEIAEKQGETNRVLLKALKKMKHSTNKAIVPDYVAKWIQKVRYLNWHIADLFAPESFDSDFAIKTREWLANDIARYDVLARAWLDGYDIVE